MIGHDQLRDIQDIATIRLKRKNPTHSDIVTMVKQCLTEAKLSCSERELDNIVSEIEYNIPIASFEPDVLVENPDSAQWFNEASKDIKLRYFNRYRAYLRHEGFSENVIDGIENDCKKVLSFSANPNANTDRKRGLVVGDVQAGKTANYTALINMACDYGYKIIVLLAGMTDSLREQTQTRIDQGFIGADSDSIGGNIQYVGVGVSKEDYYAIPLTNAECDFVKFVKKNQNSTPADYTKPIVLVVKKNGKILDQVQQWLMPGKNRISSPNILIIDDEADNASVNTKRSEDNPTVINGVIRKLFGNFSVATYVGYTATPFANIFINPNNDSSLENLFPSDYIVQLKAPDNYFGAHKVFDSLSHIRIVDESENNFLPAIHKRDYCYTGLADSLKEAVCAFLLGCVIRTLRGHSDKHRSMLINISRFNDLHSEIKIKINEYIEYLTCIIEQDSYKSPEQFIQNIEMKRLFSLFTASKYFAVARKEFSFELIQKKLLEEIKQFLVVVINNSNTKDRFKYKDYKDVGARVIVIGGFVLSRGLTLEGLMISYYSRNASAYDSLLQMCRWFGYRFKYEDLCILYLSQINIDNFRAVIDAVDNLKDQFSEMSRMRQKPKEFGLMVKESPDSLVTAILVTSRNKMIHTKSIEHWITYGGEVADTSKLYKDTGKNAANINQFRDFIHEICLSGTHFESKEGRNMICNVPKEGVAAFIKRLKIHIENRKFDTTCLSDYIAQSHLFPLWDIVVATGDSEKKWNVENITVSATIRDSEIRDNEDFIRVAGKNNRLIEPGIFNSGLSPEQRADLRARVAGAPSVKDYLSVNDRNPLMVIYPIDLRKNGYSIDDNIYLGFALGFPAKGKSEKAKYRANKVKLDALAKGFIDDRDENEELNND